MFCAVIFHWSGFQYSTPSFLGSVIGINESGLSPLYCFSPKKGSLISMVLKSIFFCLISKPLAVSENDFNVINWSSPRHLSMVWYRIFSSLTSLRLISTERCGVVLLVGDESASIIN